MGVGGVYMCVCVCGGGGGGGAMITSGSEKQATVGCLRVKR